LLYLLLFSLIRFCLKNNSDSYIYIVNNCNSYVVIDMSRILVRHDLGGDEFFVPYWISSRGNLCWKNGEILYVKLKNGYTSMLVDGEWKRADHHTTAKVPSPSIPKAEIQKTELTKLRNDLQSLTL